LAWLAASIGRVRPWLHPAGDRPAARRPLDVEGPLDAVAHRRGALGVQRGDRLVDGDPVGGGPGEGLGGAGERHHPDPQLLRQLLHEGGGRLLGGDHAGRLHVGGVHRAGDVHHQHDGGLLLGHQGDRLGPGEAGEQAGHGEQVERWRQVPAPAGRAGDDVGEQVEVGEAHRVAGAAPLREQVGGQCDGDEQQ
jgi:hypothetical protein